MQKKHLIGYPSAVVLAFAVGAAGSGASPSTMTTTAPAPTATVTVTPAPRPADPQPAAATTATDAKPPTTLPGDGTYEVGVDIQPGKYASGTPTSGNCYWARLSTDDPFDGILANNNSSGPSVVVIKKTDAYFQTSGCADWTTR